MASKNQTNQTPQSVQQPRFRRWIKPNDRAENFANELKAKVHIKGKKAGQPLTEAEIFLRKGALLIQSDHAGLYKYKKALDEGKSKEEAAAYSKEIGKKK